MANINPKYAVGGRIYNFMTVLQQNAIFQMSPAETPTPKRISNVSTRRRRKVQFEPVVEEETFEYDANLEKNDDIKDNAKANNAQEVSDLKAKMESLELEKIELERKIANMAERLETENPDVNQNIAQDVGDIKYTILGKGSFINFLIPILFQLHMLRKCPKIAIFKGTFKNYVDHFLS